MQKPIEVELYPFLIECCSTKVKPDRVIALEPDYKYIDRYLVYGHCSKCYRPLYKLFEYDRINGHLVINRDKPKRLKHLDKWLERLERQEVPFSFVTRIKTGNKSAMAFIYGKSKETPAGVVHTGYDFNGTKRKEFVFTK